MLAHVLKLQIQHPHRMLDIIRDASAGQLFRWVTKNRILLYPDEREGFVLPKLVSLLSVYHLMANGLTTFSQAAGAPLKRPAPDGEQFNSQKSDPEKAAPDTTK
jgi:DHA1 family multidrug resistance protein-like MFS transporter